MNTLQVQMNLKLISKTTKKKPHHGKPLRNLFQIPNKYIPYQTKSKKFKKTPPI